MAHEFEFKGDTWMVEREHDPGYLAPERLEHFALGRLLIRLALVEMADPDRQNPDGGELWGVEVEHEGRMYKVWNETKRRTICSNP